MSWTRAPGTGRPSASVTTPRTTTARAGVGKIRSAAKIRVSCAKRTNTNCEDKRKAANAEEARRRDAAEERPETEDMWELLRSPPGARLDVRGETGLLTYAGA